MPPPRRTRRPKALPESPVTRAPRSRSGPSLTSPAPCTVAEPFGLIARAVLPEITVSAIRGSLRPRPSRPRRSRPPAVAALDHDLVAGDQSAAHRRRRVHVERASAEPDLLRRADLGEQPVLLRRLSRRTSGPVRHQPGVEGIGPPRSGTPIDRVAADARVVDRRVAVGAGVDAAAVGVHVDRVGTVDELGQVGRQAQLVVVDRAVPDHELHAIADEDPAASANVRWASRPHPGCR